VALAAAASGQLEKVRSGTRIRENWSYDLGRRSFKIGGITGT
jgi:hypothetical protein